MFTNESTMFGISIIIVIIHATNFLCIFFGVASLSEKGVLSFSFSVFTFGFITGVEHSAHFFAVGSSSTPQLTQYDKISLPVTLYFNMKPHFNESYKKTAFDITFGKAV